MKKEEEEETQVVSVIWAIFGGIYDVNHHMAIASLSNSVYGIYNCKRIVIISEYNS